MLCDDVVENVSGLKSLLFVHLLGSQSALNVSGCWLVATLPSMLEVLHFERVNLDYAACRERRLFKGALMFGKPWTVTQPFFEGRRTFLHLENTACA